MKKIANAFARNGHSLKFKFDIEKFTLLTTHHEKMQCITENLKQFSSKNTNLIKASISQQVQNNMENFVNVVHEYVDSIATRSYFELSLFLSVFATTQNELPHSEKYSNFADLIAHYCFSDKNNIKIYLDTFHYLFSQQELCNRILKNSQIFSILNSLSDSPDNIDRFFENILTPQLIKSFENSSYNELFPQIFTFIMSQKVSNSFINSSVLFFAKIAKEISNNDNKFIDNLLEKGIFDLISSYLLKNDAFSLASQFYSLFIKVYPKSQFDSAQLDTFSIPYHTTAINNLIELYIKSSTRMQFSILSLIYSFEEIYSEYLCKSQYCFPIEKFAVLQIFQDKDCIKVYSNIVNKFTSSNPHSVEKAFQAILSFLKPPIKPNILYQKIFKMISKAAPKISSDIFHDNLFLNSFVVEPSDDESLLYFKFPSFLKTVSLLLHPKRNNHRKSALINKIIRLSTLNPIMQYDLLSLLSQNFGPDILRFYIKNIANKDFQDTFVPYLPFTVYNFKNMFITGNCFEIIEKNIISPNYILELFKFIHLVVYQTNDHFFDEWVIRQPKDSPIFQVDGEAIKELIIPSHDDAAIYIPSLLPLLKEKFESSSPFNMYLISRFATPIYQKLGISNPYYPDFYSFFITDIMSINPNSESSFPKIIDEIPCYEFFPHSSIGFLTVKYITVTSISFNIKFKKVSTEPICFMRFSGLAMIFQDNKIKVGKDFSIYVSTNQWIHVFVRSKKSNKTKITIQKSSCHFPKHFQFECLGDNNGLAFLPYMIDSNISINNNEKSIGLIQEHGSVAFVPIHTLHNLMEIHQNIVQLKRRYLEDVNTRNIPFLLQFDKYVSPENLHSFYTDIFDSILSIFGQNRLNDTDDGMINDSQEEIKKTNDNWEKIIETFLNQILNISDIQIRTSIISAILFDIETYSRLSLAQIISLLEVISTKICNPSFTAMKNDTIFTKYNVLFSFNLINYFQNKHFQNLFLTFWNLISENLEDYNVVNKIVPIVFTIKFYNLNHSENVNKFIVGNLLHEYTLTNEYRTLLINFLFRLEIFYQTTFFSFDQLLEIAMTQTEEISKIAFQLIIERDVDSSNIIKNMSVFCKIAQKFASQDFSWSFFVQKMTKQNDFLNINYDQINHVNNPELITIILSMTLAVSHDESILKSKAYEFLNVVLPKIENNILFNDSNICYLSDLITGGREFDIPLFVEKLDVSIVSSFIFNQSEILASHIYEAIPLFTGAIGQNYEKYSFLPPPNSFCEANLNLFFKLFQKNFKYKKNLKILLNILSKVDNEMFLHSTILNILGFLESNETNEIIINTLKKFLYHLYIKCPKLFTKKFVKELFDNCKNFNQFQMLSLFIVYQFAEYELNEFILLIRQFGKNFISYNFHDSLALSINLLKRVKDIFDQTGDMQNQGFVDEIISYLSLFQKYLNNNEDLFIKSIGQHCVTILEKHANASNIFFEDLTAESFSEFDSLIEPYINKIKSSKILSRVISNLDMIRYSMFIIEKISQSVLKCYKENKDFYFNFNHNLRKREFISSQNAYKNSIRRFQDAEETPKSYKFSPFFGPFSSYKTILPSQFSLKPPNTQDQDSNPKIKEKLINSQLLYLYPKKEIPIKVTDEYPENIFRYSGIYHCSSSNLIDHFQLLYGKIENIANCQLIRVDHRVDSIAMELNQNLFLVLTNAKYVFEKKKISLLPISQDLCEDFLNGDFGRFTMFCGHFVLIISIDDILLSSKYVSVNNPNSIIIHSVTSGAFILEFTDQYKSKSDIFKFPYVCAYRKYSLSINEAKQLWLNNKISNFSYLMIINKYAYRSPCDLSSFPIFPRILNDFSSDSFQFTLSDLRDLSRPIQLTIDDNDGNVYKRKSNADNSFYSENVSNPMFVSGLIMRLSPFCREIWYLNDGWDHGDRNFVSILSHFSTKKTVYEFPPEAFVGETFLNWNNFIMPNGEKLNMLFPKWAKNNAFTFSELHKYLLEMKNTREALHSWIDLMFGAKQRSSEDMNVFAPMSYVEYNKSPSQVSPAALSQQRTWVLQCGRVPHKIFDDPHELCSTTVSLDKNNTTKSNNLSENQNKDNSANYEHPVGSENDISSNEQDKVNQMEASQSNQEEEEKSEKVPKPSLIASSKESIIHESIIESKMKNMKFYLIYEWPYIYELPGKLFLTFNKGIAIINNSQYIKCDTSLENSLWANNIFLSNDAQYAVISSINNSLTAYQFFYENNIPIKFRPISRINCDLPISSSIHSEQLLCATAHQNGVLLWSIATGAIIKHVDIPNASVVEFDEVSDLLYIGANTTLYQLSLSCVIIRKIELPDKITSLKSFGFGFSFIDRAIFVGHLNGYVRLCAVKFETGEFYILSEKQPSRLPIYKIKINHTKHLIEVLDLSCVYPSANNYCMLSL